MKSMKLNVILGVGICCLILFLFSNALDTQKKELLEKHQNFEKEEEFSNEAEERNKYFFMLLRDPATNSIPYHIREKELKFAKKIEQINKLMKTTSSQSLQWKEAGPVDVGGRTRALAVDVANSNTIIAGGASGGIWKSTDNGNTWKMKSRTDQLLSITSIAQDIRAGHTDTWYFSGGEFSGSANDRGYTANFTGNGIYKSTNNGETWNVLPNTFSSDVTQFDSPFDYTSKIVVNPTTGSVFVASNIFGILRSKDGNTFNLILGAANEHVYNDVVVSANGTLVASLSSPYQGTTPQLNPGIYKSTNDGDDWTEITPNIFPSTHFRSVLAIPPSNQSAVYVFTNTGEQDQNKHDILKFYKINMANNTADDRSANLPDFTNLGQEYNQGILNTQGNYNMTLAVKPDDENFVLIAATCIFRSTDGFASKLTDPVKDWIGGYNPTTFFYPSFHPDIHSFAFDPNDPKKMWWGNDGGLAYTTNITNTSFNDLFPWENKNNGYDVTQYYMISISKDANDDRFMGGCQDNGTPFYRFDGNSTTPHIDVSLGDGAFSYLGSDFAFAETQKGNLMRLHYDQSGNVLPAFVGNNPFSIIFPTNASNQLFVNPFTVDPIDENVMFYLAGADIWRNDQLSSIPDNIYGGTNIGWTKLDNLTASQGYIMSAISISNFPAHILYYAESGDNSTKPKIFRLENANTAASGAVDISIPNAPAGAYVHHIAINPDDANEIIVVISNYNIVGLYHSTDGGKNYTAIEGNLQGDQQNPGPSLRCATILPAGSATNYYLATSTGVYSTSQLNGNNTQWSQEGADVIGNVVSNYIISRKSDGKVVVGTHGRGAFFAYGNGGSGNPILTLAANQLKIDAKPGFSGQNTFNISNTGDAQLNFSITPTGGPAKVLSNLKLNKKYLLPSNKMNSELLSKNLDKLKFQISHKNNLHSSVSKTEAEEELILDDGDAFADGFLGYGGLVYLYWRNDFKLDKDFKLEKIRYFMKTETATTNSVEVAVVSSDGNILVDTVTTTDLARDGKWFELQLPSLNSLQFSNGDLFSVIVLSLNNQLTFPAGYDDDGKKPDNSYIAYYDPSLGGYFSGYANLNTISQNGAWLIRAIGNSAGGGNQNPVAIAAVKPSPAPVNTDVSFDGTNSYDNDGQIATYLWDFGDGSSSNQAKTTHKYTQAGTFNYSLKVTDNLGAQSQVNDQIQITQGGGNLNPVAIAQVSPNPANINSDVTFDGSNSYDNDGQIVSYLWDFGDGNTSTSATIKHQYTQVGNYNYSLTVTDNMGAQGQTTGQITIQQQSTSRFTITPSNGNISAGLNQNISVTFDAHGLAEGTYQAQLNITSNGGNTVLPIIIEVSNTVDVKTVDNSPKEFKLQQNFPNPFNPTTTITYSISKLSFVKLIIYDMLGKEIETLVQRNEAPGNYNVIFNGDGLASGIYIYRIQANNLESSTGQIFSDTKKFVLLK